MWGRATCFLAATYLFVSLHAYPDQGKWTYDLNQDLGFVAVQKSLFANSDILIKIMCGDSHMESSVSVSWTLRSTPCWEEYLSIQGIVNSQKNDKNDIVFRYFTEPSRGSPAYRADQFGYVKAKASTHRCNGVMVLERETEKMSVRTVKTPPAITEEGDAVNKDDGGKKQSLKERKAGEEKAEPLPVPLAKRKRSPADEEDITDVEWTTTTGAPEEFAPVLAPEINKATGLKTNQPVYTVPVDGVYLLIIHMESSPSTGQPNNFNATVNIEMKGPHGYLSAADWPLLPFYGCMCGLYVVYGVAWLVMSFMQWREILRVQFWIGGVILLGMLEKAVFYSEYQSINSSGQSVKGAVVFAELVSTAKRTLARILIIIVSLGFGIVKPRLGAMLHRVVGIGGLYFLLGSIEGVLRVIRPKNDPSNQALLASIPLSVLDAGICWWIFSSLVQTLRTLRLRRNLVKLSLYRHFTNTLIFAVLASVAFMLWSIKYHRLQPCLTDWKELWVDDAYWHLLFSLILLVIIILWRPTINNQRYAFTPLLDADDDEEDEEDNMISDAFEGMKLRGSNRNDKASPKGKTPTEEDDLKWVEENIPASGPDDLLPKLLDSDEEIMTTQLERSKME